MLQLQQVLSFHTVTFAALLLISSRVWCRITPRWALPTLRTSSCVGWASRRNTASSTSPQMLQSSSRPTPTHGNDPQPRRTRAGSTHRLVTPDHFLHLLQHLCEWFSGDQWSAAPPRGPNSLGKQSLLSVNLRDYSDAVGDIHDLSVFRPERNCSVS